VRKFMKLFKSLLVAPATLGLLAPMAATANEVTISDFTPAEELAITNSRVDGLEARMNDFEAGSFSETTTASFTVDTVIGAVDGTGQTALITDGTEAVEAYYGFQIDLATSFTGEDALAVSIDAGNSFGSLGEADLNGPFANAAGGTDGLSVDGVSYTFPVAGATVVIGDNTDGSVLFSKACVYGGGTTTLGDCGALNTGFDGAGTALGASYDFDNGFTVAAGYAGDGSTNGLLTDEGLDEYGFNAMYTGDTYGISLAYATLEQADDSDDNFTSINAYWAPEGFPSISVGYEWGVNGNLAANADGLTSYFVGLQFEEVGPGTLGVALGNRVSTPEGTDEQ